MKARKIELSMPKALFPVVLAGLLACAYSHNKSDHSAYAFDGVIDSEQITFTEGRSLFGPCNLLEVVSADGTTRRFMDNLNDDLKLERVDVLRANESTRYSVLDELQEPKVKEFQKMFNMYLERIVADKSNVRIN